MHIIYGLQMVSENVEFSCATDFSLILLKMIFHPSVKFVCVKDLYLIGRYSGKEP